MTEHRVRLILAAPEVAIESALVLAAGRAGVQVVRRPVDAADLLAAAAMEPTTPVILGVELPRLRMEVVGRLEPDRRPVLGIAAGAEQTAQLQALGVHQVVDALRGPQEVLTQILDLLAPTTTLRKDPTEDGVGDLWDRIVPGGPGTLIAVWGPPGAPGRSTLTCELSAEIARRRHRVCAVDADTYAPSLAFRLGVLDDLSGLIVACRHADNGSLSIRTLLSATRLLGERWYLLTGLGRAERWPDLRPAALDRVWATCQDTFDATLVDVGACLESTATTSIPGLAMERNAAARTALHRCDAVLVVSRTDPLHVARLLSSLPQVQDLAADRPMRLVLTCVDRRDRAPDRVRDLLGRVGLELPIDVIHRDLRAHERAAGTGATTRQAAPRSRSNRDVQRIAQAVIGNWLGQSTARAAAAA